jgi:hypothetical protein
VHTQPDRTYRYWLAGILAVAGLWRIVIATLLPALARDGVTFCWYARDLGRQGIAFLQTPEAAQHPLFPALIFGAQRLTTAVGLSDSPMTWQRCGQFLSLLGGMVVVVLVGAIARRLTTRLALPIDARRVTLFALALAAVLPLNVWLSADVMSDQVHLAFYLAAVYLILRLETPSAALACGVLGGLAFLTRQEGVVIVPAGIATIIAAGRAVGYRKRLLRAALLIAGFVACVSPYWISVGRFSAKKDPLDLLPGGHASEAGSPVRHFAAGEMPAQSAAHASAVSPGGRILAKLVREDVPILLVPFRALVELFRAGRVVVPLFALLPLVNLRRRFLEPHLVGLVFCLAGHLVLTCILLKRYGYLQPRHMLVPTVLLIPFAAMLLARFAQLASEGRALAWNRAAIAVCLVPLALYSLRVPNWADRFYPDVARWIRDREPDPSSKTLLSGSGGRRIAFYAGMPWQPWPEDPADYPVVVDHIRVSRPGYFAIELGAGDERAGKQALADRLLADPAVTPMFGEIHRRPIPGGELILIELREQAH